MRAFFSISLLLLSAVLPLSAAKAAPQSLGVIASDGIVPLHCVNGVCSAELSSFCLQPNRRVPPPGTEYSAFDDEAVTLVLTMPDGTIQRTAAPGHLRFVSSRNYTAVTASIAALDVTRMGAVAAAVEIGEGMTLLPVPRLGDLEPQSDADIELAVAARRGTGTRIVDHDDDATAARALNLVINQLSPEAHASVTPREALWRNALQIGQTNFDGSGMSRAAKLYRACQTPHDNDAALRWCLQLRHDGLVIRLNSDYWEALRTGS